MNRSEFREVGNGDGSQKHVLRKEILPAQPTNLERAHRQGQHSYAHLDAIGHVVREESELRVVRRRHLEVVGLVLELGHL